MADCLIAFEMLGLDGKVYEKARDDVAERVQLLITEDAATSLKLHPINAILLGQYANQKLHGRRPFHWAVEFSEVFGRGGFDALIGNPPFLGGQKITGAMGVEYRDFIVRKIADGRKGSADLSVFFMLEAALLSRPLGVVGRVLTSAIAE